MTVQQVLRKLGQWSIKLRPDAPPGLLSQLDFLGHVAVIPGRVNPAERGEECLTLARYVGVLRIVEAGEQVSLSGSGMAYWLGDEDGKGPVIEAPGVTLSGATFANSIRALLPASGAVTEGTLTAVAGTYSGSHIYQTARTALDYVCDLFDADWRVTNDGRLDAGPPSALFVTAPRAVIARRDVAGADLSVRALAGDLSSTRSAADYTTRVVVVAEGLATGSASAATVPYRDIHGGTVAITRVVDEQDDTQSSNASARAQMVLNLWSGTRRSVRLDVSDFDVAGDIQPGDVVWAWDPDAGIADATYEVPFRGRILNPMPVRALAITWPVTDGYTVAYRSSTGAWADLSEWVDWESPGGGEVEVGDSLSSSLTAGIGSIGTQVSGGGGGAGDPSIPGVPVFGAFSSSSYQPGNGLAQTSVKVSWTQPLNTDGSTIVDGDHYEVRYRPTGTSDWQVAYVAWDQASLTVTALPPATGFDWQIRAVDYASPVNYGAWSSTGTYTTAQDTTAPATPAPPTVAASLIAVQLTHTLGLASGGTFNLPLDMDHFEVHLGTFSGFAPSASTLAGELRATGAMVSGSIPAVGTFAVDTLIPANNTAYVKVIAVDRTGNRSTASSAASATAQLIDNAHITDLTASKITAGTLSAAYTLSGSIKTGASGARVEQDTAGVRLYNSAGALTVDLNTGTGNASIAGTFRTGLSGQRIVIDSTGNGTMFFYPASGSDYAFINAPQQNSVGVNSGTDGGSSRTRLWARSDGVELKFMNLDQSQRGGWLYVNAGGITGTAINGGIVALSGASGVSLTAQSGIALFGTSSNRYLQLDGGGNSVLTAGSGVLTLGGTGIGVASDGYVTVAAAGTLGVTTSSGTALFGGPNNKYLQFPASGNSQYRHGDSSVDLTGTTILLNASAVRIPTLPTTSLGANAYWSPSTGQAYYNASSRKIKTEIETAPAIGWLAATDALDVVTFYDKAQVEESGGTTGVQHQLGLIAEDVLSAPRLGALLGIPGVIRESDGAELLPAVAYDRVALAVLLALRELRTDHAARLNALEAARA